MKQMEDVLRNDTSKTEQFFIPAGHTIITDKIRFKDEHFDARTAAISFGGAGGRQ
ncbi:MAG: hypothetical protein RSB23_04015 [Alistipes sp.]